MKAISRAAIAGEWEAYACGVRSSMTTRRRHRNSSNEQPISLDHGALLHAADSSEELWTQRGPESQQLGAWPVQHTPSVVLRTSDPGPARRCLLERRHSEVKDDLSLCTSQSHSARSCDFVHMADPPADSCQPHHIHVTFA